MKTKLYATKVILLLLCLAMVTAAFAACTNPKGKAENTTAASKETEVTLRTDEYGYLMDDIPEDLKYDRVVNMLGEKDYQWQYCGEEESTTDGVLRVIYERNMTVEERLGVEFHWKYVVGHWGAREGYINEIIKTCDGGTPYEAFVAYNLVPPVVASRGYAANLYETKYLDLSAPWWPSAYLEQMIVNEKVFSLVESNDYGVLRNMMAVFFNTEMLESRNLEDPYQLVKNNEWTISKLNEMIKETYEDANNSNTKDIADVFGCVTATNAKMDAWLYGLGYKLTTINNDGEIEFLISDPGIGEYIDLMREFFLADDALTYDPNMHKIFLEERAYFYAAGLLMATDIKNQNLDLHYGVVPMPKLTSEQDRYYTHLSNTHDAWGAPYNAPDMDCTSAIMECMASEAYRSIGPTYYDLYLKIRYAPDADIAAMYDLIRDSITFDFAYLFSCVFTENPKDLLKTCITDPTKSWATVYASKASRLDAEFQKIVEVYQ